MEIWTLANIVTAISYVAIPVAIVVSITKAGWDTLKGGELAALLLVASFVFSCAVHHGLFSGEHSSEGELVAYAIEAFIAAATALLFVFNTNRIAGFLRMRRDLRRFERWVRVMDILGISFFEWYADRRTWMTATGREVAGLPPPVTDGPWPDSDDLVEYDQWVASVASLEEVARAQETAVEAITTGRPYRDYTRQKNGNVVAHFGIPDFEGIPVVGVSAKINELFGVLTADAPVSSEQLKLRYESQLGSLRSALEAVGEAQTAELMQEVQSAR